ncbi:hypothetical protein, partial [Mycolicibacterium conceptionense]
MIKPGRAMHVFTATGWGVLVVALWLGLIAATASTAHADPDREKSTTQSANDSDKPTKIRDKAGQLGPRKAKTHREGDGTPRQRPRLSVPRPSAGSLPTPADVRDAVDELGAQVRTTLTSRAGHTSKVRAAQPLPRPKVGFKRDALQLPRVAGTAVADEAAPDIADAITAVTGPTA